MFGICIYGDFYNYIYGKKVYMSREIIKDIGKYEWYDLLHEFVGMFTVDRNNGIAIDTLYMELVELFPWIFEEDMAAVQDQLEKILNIYRQARRERITAVKQYSEYNRR